MKKLIKSIMFLAVVAIGFGSLASCSDDDESTMSRLFRPVINEDNITAGLDADNIPYISFKWDDYAEANQYVLTIQKEDGSGLQETAVEEATITFNGLDYDCNYNITIKALNTVSGLESKEYQFTVKSADYPTDLIALTSADIIDTQCRVSWNRNDGATVYDKLLVYNSDDELVVEQAVTEADLEAGNVIIRGLEPNKSYVVRAYNGEAYKGKRSFKTAASEAYEGTVIDLRGLDAEESRKAITSDALAEWVATYPDQDITIVMQGGTNYLLETLKLPSTTGKIKFVTGLSLAGNAVFKVDGNFDAANGVAVGGIAFEKIFFDEGETKLKTDGNYGGTYLFNPSSDAHIKNIEIKDCTIKYKRGIARFRKNTVDNIVIDNCIIDSIGGYGIVNADDAATTIGNVTVKNSTIAHCDVTFAGSKAPFNSVLLENCTFAYFCNSGKCLFDFDKQTVSSITVNKCVFGVSKGDLRAWKGNTTPTCNDCYFTSDLKWLVAEGATEPTAQLSGTTLKTDMKGTFKDPAKSDFTVITNELKNVGDLRWYN